ncbi:MAG TPA: hypothetical protein VFT91_05350 [Dehalococcoidia bacterium]|nr:hypothetical protein [Dehalococcoidia bacterium]
MTRMTLGTGLAALLVGMFLLIIGMYSWASLAGTFAFFIGFALAMAGGAVVFIKAGSQRR